MNRIGSSGRELSRLGGAFAAVHKRHCKIDQQQITLVSLFEEFQSRPTTCGIHDLMSHLLEYFFRQTPHGIIIVDDKYAKASRWQHAYRGRLPRCGCCCGATEIQMHGRALAQHAFDCGYAADLPRETIHHREAEPTALPRALGGENGSNALAATSFDMPDPVSPTDTST